MLKIKTKKVKDNVLVSIKGDCSLEECIVTSVDLISKTSKSYKIDKDTLLKLITKFVKKED